MTTIVLYDLGDQLNTPMDVSLDKLNILNHSTVPIVPSILAGCEKSEKLIKTNYWAAVAHVGY